MKGLYSQYIKDFPVLTPAKEKELTQEYFTTRDIGLRNKLVTHNLRLVFRLAKKYNRNGIQEADLIGEGNLGLIRAVEKFDPSKRVTLGSYAYSWIKAYMLKYMIRDAHPVKMGTTTAQRKIFLNLPRVRAKSEALNNNTTNETLADILDVKPKDIQEMSCRMSAPLVQLNHNSYSDTNSDSGYLNRILRERFEEEDRTPEQICESKIITQYMKEVIDSFADKLTDTNKTVFLSRIVSDKYDRDTLEAVGQKLNGLTRERIRQIQVELKRKFKRHLSQERVRP